MASGYVTGERQQQRLAAGLAHRCREGRRIGVVDLPRTERRARRHQLITGRQDRDAWLPPHRKLGQAQ